MPKVYENQSSIRQNATADSYSEQKLSSKKRKRIKRTIILLLVFALLRISLPYLLLNYVNKKLSELKEYRGKVKDIDVAIFRGAYVIKEMNIVRIEKSAKKAQGSDTVPFFQAPVIDLSVEWRSLFKGKLVGEIYVENPVLNFVKGSHKQEDVKADTADFKKTVKNIMPLTVNHFEITNGQIHYIDNTTYPKVDVSMKKVKVMARNLSNVNDSSKTLPAHLEAQGIAYDGNFKLWMDLDALSHIPKFDLKAEMTSMNLVKVNSFFKAYGNFEIKKGVFNIFTEFAAKDGEYGGYVKPILKNLEIKQGEGGLKEIIWESIAQGAAKVLSNPHKEQIATKVNIHGKFDASTRINTWRAVSFVLRNAFVEALKPSIDNTINVNHLEETGKKTILEKIFGTGKKKEKN